MIRLVIIACALSGCAATPDREPVFIKTGYVARSFSVDAERGRIGFTFTFDNVHLPESGANCIGIEVCTTTVE